MKFEGLPKMRITSKHILPAMTHFAEELRTNETSMYMHVLFHVLRPDEKGGGVRDPESIFNEIK